MRVGLALAACAAGLCAQPLLIENTTVIDATGAAPLKNTSVLIDKGRIAQIARKIAKPRDALVVNGKGKFLIPGLWDMHVHITDPDWFFPQFRAAGVTGVREMYSGIPAGVAASWRARPDAPLLALPGFVDGPLLGTPPPGAFTVATPDQARAAVQILAQSGADFIKVYNSLPKEAYFALAETARAIGIPFVGHVPEEVSPREAALAGQRSQEHLINILLACSSREEELRRERIAVMNTPALSPAQRARELGFPRLEGLADSYNAGKAQELFRVFAESGTWQTPTLALLQGFAQMDAGNASGQPLLSDLRPEQLTAFQDSLRRLLVRYKTLVRDMHASGVQFLAGTDTSATNPVRIGFGLHHELALLVESGFTTMEALQTATRNPALYFGQLTQMGTVESGKVANLVLLDADPLKDIRNLAKVRGVVFAGRWEGALGR